ncbi:MAG: carboxypeptidase-like regulatory domain-containing protein [Myxococcota bacterium]|nr:carboxypeptidase-like regulatory domain-containing protein [Myxococcota bacterium]
MFLLLLACSGTRFEGSVVDVNGAPVAGAMVTVVGQPCQTVVQEDGTFSLPCASGVHDLSVGRSGYLSQSWEQLEATERKAYDLGQTTLVKVPEQEGLLVFQAGSYQPMERGFLVKDSGGRGVKQFRHYCLPEGATERMPVNRFPAGEVAFFDNHSEGWRPWKLDREGCAYRMSPTSETRWGVDYSEKADWTETRLAEGQKLVVMTLEPGAYFIADWGNGFFVKGASDDPKIPGYSGALVLVE